jgi:hypothetical protein
MVFRRNRTVGEVPANCLDCPLSPKRIINECGLPLTANGYWINKYSGKRHELCPLIELTSGDIEFLLREVKRAALSEIPEHKSEVEITEKLINRLEIIKNITEQEGVRMEIIEYKGDGDTNGDYGDMIIFPDSEDIN